MLRTVFVIIHVASGIGGLLIGPAVFRPRPGRPDAVRLAYPILIALLLGSLLGMIALDWGDLEPAAKIAFLALTGLGVAMLIRILLAAKLAAAATPGWEHRYIDHVFFTYIALWIGFLILPALSLPYPAVTAPLVAVGVLALGLVALGRYKRRVLGEHAAR